MKYAEGSSIFAVWPGPGGNRSPGRGAGNRPAAGNATGNRPVAGNAAGNRPALCAGSRPAAGNTAGNRPAAGLVGGEGVAADAVHDTAARRRCVGVVLEGLGLLGVLVRVQAVAERAGRHHRAATVEPGACARRAGGGQQRGTLSASAGRRAHGGARRPGTVPKDRSVITMHVWLLFGLPPRPLRPPISALAAAQGGG